MVAVHPGAGAVHRRDVGLDDAAVGDGDVEARVGGQARDGAGERDAGQRLGMIDDVVAFDRSDAERRAGFGDGDGLARRRLVAVGVGDLRGDGGGAVGQGGGVRGRDRRRPTGRRAVDGGDIGLGDAAVGDGDVEARVGGRPETVPESATPASASV